MEKINLIFDFDGTLFDSYPAIIEWVQRGLIHFNVNANPNEIREMSLFHTVDYTIEEYSKRFNLNYKELYDYMDHFKKI